MADSRRMSVMNALGLALLDLLVPVHCAGCALPGSAVCETCRGVGIRDPVSRRIEVGPSSLEVWSAAEYAGTVRRLVLEFKDRGTPVLRSLLAEWAMRALSVWAMSTPGPLLVVPLHSGPVTRAAAGCDVPPRLAQCAVGGLRGRGMKLRVVDLIAVDRRRARQKELPARERLARVGAQPAVRARIPGRDAGSGPPCVLFDDVVTTGASLISAARAVESAGWRVVGGATLATVQTSAGGSTAASDRLPDSVVPIPLSEEVGFREQP